MTEGFRAALRGGVEPEGNGRPEIEVIASASSPADPSAPSQSSGELAVLQKMCHAFASTSNPDEILKSAIRWMRAVLGDSTLPIRMILPDRSGRLRATIGDGQFPAEGRGRLARRRAAFASKRAAFVDVFPPGQLLATLPLVSRGESEGLIEIVGSRHTLEQRWATIDAASGLIAIALRTSRQRTTLAAELQAVEQAATLTTEIVRADTPELAARATLRYCFRRFGLPVAAWIRRGHEPIMEFSGAEGLTARKRAELHSVVPSLGSSKAINDRQRLDISRRFQEITGAQHVIVVDAGEAVLAAGRPEHEPDGQLGTQLQVLGHLLVDVLRHLAAVAKANDRNRNLDLGIAWTAHELRGPLLGAKATIEQLLWSGVLPASEERLSRSRDELARLAGLVDEVLSWSVGGAKLRFRPIDLAQLVLNSTHLIARERDEDRIRVNPGPPVIVTADPVQLGVAIDNLIRNALHYSPAGSPVEVSVISQDGHATVSVQDHGPGIPPDERGSIFDPLVRGQASAGSRAGHGLGLFVAKRVVDAHGGEIWLEPAHHAGNTSGTVFHVRLLLAPSDAGRPIRPRSKGVPKEG